MRWVAVQCGLDPTNVLEQNANENLKSVTKRKPVTYKLQLVTQNIA